MAVGLGVAGHHWSSAFLFVFDCLLSWVFGPQVSVWFCLAFFGLLLGDFNGFSFEFQVVASSQEGLAGGLFG